MKEEGGRGKEEKEEEGGGEEAVKQKGSNGEETNYQYNEAGHYHLAMISPAISVQF